MGSRGVGDGLVLGGGIGPAIADVSGDPASHVGAPRVLDRRPGLPPLAIWSTGPVVRLPGRKGWAWNPIDRSARISDRSDVCDRALATGCIASDRGWELVGDRLGVRQTFHATVDGTMWFSTSAQGLIDLVRSAVGVELDADGPDPVGWQSILLVGFPAPGRSAFRSIRTLCPGGSVLVTSSGTIRETGSTPPPESAGRRGIPELVDSLRRALPHRRQALDLPLSGGWDSRILAGLLAERRRPNVSTWTTSTDDGVELDLELAPAVARYLGYPHCTFVDTESTWPDLDRAVLRRTDYQTWLHAWLAPLAGHLRSNGAGALVDGFGGDFVLRRLFQTFERDSSPGRDARRAIWWEMGGSRAASELGWSDQARAWFDTGAFASFDAATVGYDDHRAWQALVVLTTRAARCIGAAPFQLYEPEIAVHVPFLAEPVRTSLLAEGIYDRRGGELYRAILASVDAGLAALPSTNDPELERRRTSAQRERSIRSLTEMAAQIAPDDDAMRLLGPRLRAAVGSGDIDELVRLTAYVVPMRTLQAVFALTQFRLDFPASRRGIWDL